MIPPPVPTVNQTDRGLRPYLHLLAYGVPSAFFVIFASLVLLPRVERIWEMAGPKVSKAEWVIDLCRTFVDNFYFLSVGGVLLFIALEKMWPGWQAVRRPAIKTLAWVITFSVMTCMTWVCVTTCLAIPVTRSKAAQDGQTTAPSR